MCWKINSTDPDGQEKIWELDFANHGLTVMSVGTITIEDGVMFGPEVALLTVNHEPKNIRVIFAKEILIKRDAWIGARVNILPGVTIGENAIVGTGSIVTKDIPDNAVAVGNPARVMSRPELKHYLASLNDYDKIFMGYPVCWSIPPMAISTFLEHYDFSGKKIFPKLDAAHLIKLYNMINGEIIGKIGIKLHFYGKHGRQWQSNLRLFRQANCFSQRHASFEYRL